MFDKKGRWWPSRLADKKARKQWRKDHPPTKQFRCTCGNISWFPER